MFKSIDRFMCCFATGGTLACFELVFGKMDYSLIFLGIAILTDFCTGLMVGCKSHKLSSKKCRDGLFKKFMIIIYVLLAHHLDVLLDANYIRVAVCYMYSVSEVISVFENGVKLGVAIPEPIRKALEMLNGNKTEEK